MKKAVMLLVVSLMMLAPAFAAPPFITSSTTADSGFVIAAPIFEFVKANATFTFNWHVYNLTNGVPITAKDGISCNFHIYNSKGDHQYILEPITTYNPESQYDMEVNVAAQNFSKGFYDSIIACNNSKMGGFIKQEFEVTNTGIEPATNYLVIFMFLAALAEMAIGLYLLFFTLQHTFIKETDLKILGMNYITWFSLFFLLALNAAYFNNMFIADMLNWLVKIGLFTNMIIPTIGFIWSTIMTLFDRMRKALPGGGNMW